MKEQELFQKALSEILKENNEVQGIYTSYEYDWEGCVIVYYKEIITDENKHIHTTWARLFHSLIED